MLGGGVDAVTLVAALGAGPPPPECRWGRRPHRGATAHGESIGIYIRPRDTGIVQGCTCLKLESVQRL